MRHDKQTLEQRIETAQAEIAVGSFSSKSASKEARSNLESAFYNHILDNKDYDGLKKAGFTFWDLPSALYHVREKHEPMFKAAKLDWNTTMKLVDMLNTIKAMPIVKPKAKPVVQPTGNQATHQGTCQLCGCTHKVNNKTGLIATHGYVVDYGYFQGECFGGHKLPLEKSCDALKADVDNTSQKIRSMNPDEFTIVKKNGKEKKISNYVIIESLYRHLKTQRARLMNWKSTELTKVGA